MSVLAFVDFNVDLECSRKSIEWVLERGKELDGKYFHVEESKEISLTEATDLAISRMDPNWLEGILTLELPKAGYPITVMFFCKDRKMKVSFSGFERNPYDKTFKYQLRGEVDFALFIKLLLHFMEPFAPIGIKVGTI